MSCKAFHFPASVVYVSPLFFFADVVLLWFSLCVLSPVSLRVYHDAPAIVSNYSNLKKKKKLSKKGKPGCVDSLKETKYFCLICWYYSNCKLINYDSRYGPYIGNRRKARNNSGNMTTLEKTDTEQCKLGFEK